MQISILKDRYGMPVGNIEIRLDGKQIVRDRNGHRLGEYDPHDNVTRDGSGNRFGSGNWLSALLWSRLRTFQPTEVADAVVAYPHYRDSLVL